MAVREITVQEFHAEIAAQAAGRNEDIAFVCACCKTVQSARSLIAAGAGATFEEVEKFLGFSCVGRWTGAGPADYKNARPAAGKTGCDWTLGGLFGIHRLAIVDEGEKHPRFELATKEQAAELAAKMKESV